MRSSRPLALLLLVLSSCFGAPKVAPRGTLAARSEGPDAGPEAPFSVVHASPTGSVQGEVELSVTWSRPLRALGPGAPPPPVVLTPAVPGAWEWVGSRAARFTPRDRLPRGTELTIEVPAGTKALDGSVLAAAFRSTVTTAAPRVRVTPHEADGLGPDTKARIEVSQPVALDVLRQHTKLLVNGAESPFSLAPDEAPDTFVLAPAAKLPGDAQVEIVVDAGLRGVEGPRPMGKEARGAFHTFRPFAVEELACSRRDERCRARGDVSVVFTNRAKWAELRDAVHVEPAVKLRWPTWRDDRLAKSVSLEGDFVAGRTYTVTVGNRTAQGKPLVDEYGQALAGPQRLTFTVADHDPTVEVALDGTYLESQLLSDPPVFSTNTGKLTLSVTPLTLAQAIALRHPRKGALDDAVASPGTVSVELPGSARNRLDRAALPFARALGGRKHGLLLARAAFAAPRAVREDHLVQVTDLALTAKRDAEGALVWVTRLSTGKPVSGVTVTAVDEAAEGGPGATTDDAGFARVTMPEVTEGRRRAPTFVARLGDDVVFRSADDTLSAGRFGAVESCPSCDLGRSLVFTDRGLYRPGDTVKVKGILRDTDKRGLTVTRGTVHAEVQGPDGETLSKHDVALSPFGSFVLDVKVPEGAKLGSHRVDLTVDGDRGGVSFEVAEYRPTELEVTASLDKRDYVRGDAIACEARGRYLFGAPMAGATSRMTMMRARTAFSPPGVDGFSTADDAYRSAHREELPRAAMLAKRDDKLDRAGVAGLASKADAPQSGPDLVTCEAELQDLSRQTLTGSASAFVHPGEVYLGVRAGAERFGTVGAPLAAEVIAVDPLGRRRVGVAAHVELFRRTWKVVYFDAGGGRRHAEPTPVDTKVGACDVSTVAGVATCALRPKASGLHIVRATAVDARKNPVASSTELYVLGGGPPSWAEGDDAAIELVPDKKSYDVGDTARVLVKSPFPEAEAWITIERDGVVSSERRALSGGTPVVEVKITEDFLPNVFLGVHLVRGRTKPPPASSRKADLGAPTFREGYVPLVVDHASRRLAVTVQPDRAEHQPGERVSVDVTVKDRAGKAADAEVTLYAVDEGVLSLVGYKTPDPVETFFAPRGLRVSTVETRDALGRVGRSPSFLGPGLDKGADGGGGDALGVRKDFRQTAMFLPALRTDGEGRVHATFDLPDSLTSYRVMAVVSGGSDRFGAGEARVTTSKPLMARPALPRFLRAGDAFDASVVVTAKGERPGEVAVTLAATGLEARGPLRRDVTLGEGESREVRFPLEATRTGKASLRFDVEGGGRKDAVSLTREVSSPVRLESAAVSGSTPDAAAEALGDLSEVRSDVGGLSVTLAPTALASLAGGVEQLVEYPYGCTEQLTSRMVPLVPLRDIARGLGVTLPPDLDATLAKTAAKLQTHQRGDGGFGLWPESDTSIPWLTAYALWGLVTARDAGVVVRPSSIDDAKRYLAKELQRDAFKRDPVSAAFVVDVLARAGAPNPGAVSMLFERRDELPTFAKALLLSAAVRGEGQAEVRRALAEAITAEARLDGASATIVTGGSHRGVLDSDARSSAMVLRALVEHDAKHPLAPKLALGLVAARRGGKWRTTQETAWALLALDAYRRRVEGEAVAMDARLFLGDARLHEAHFEPGKALVASFNAPMDKLGGASGAALLFDKHGGRGVLHYEARLRFAPKTPPAAEVDRGFFVEKSLAPVTAESLAAALLDAPKGVAAKVPSGGLVLVTLTVVAPSPRDFVVLDDPLPAGLEAVDARLRGQSSLAARVDRRPAFEDEETEDESAPLTRRELRDDRAVFFIDHLPAGLHRYRYLARATTIGRFQVPATQVEEMYVPETFGRTPAFVVEVAP